MNIIITGVVFLFFGCVFVEHAGGGGDYGFLLFLSMAVLFFSRSAPADGGGAGGFGAEF